MRKNKRKRIIFICLPIVILLTAAIVFFFATGGTDATPVGLVETDETEPPETSGETPEPGSAARQVIAYDSAAKQIHIDRGLTGINPESLDIDADEEKLVYTFYMEGKPSGESGYKLVGDGRVGSYYFSGEENVLAIYAQIPLVFETSVTDDDIIISVKTLKDLYEKIVYIDAGHGGEHDGAVREKYKEKDLNLEIAGLVFKMFEEGGSGIKAIMSRTDDVLIDNYVRAERGSQLCDAIVSIHCNTFKQPNAKGSAALYNNVNGSETLYNPAQVLSPKSRLGLNSTEFAAIMQRNLCGVTGSKNRGIIERDDLVIPTASYVPAVIMEVGYMSNKDELAKLTDAEYRQKIAEGIYNGILEAFGVSK